MEGKTKFALPVVDIDFFSGHAELISRRPSPTVALNQLTHAFRRSNQPLIWIRQEFAPDLSDAFLEMWKHNLRITITGTAGANILPELIRDPSDLFVIKKRYSAFFQTNLDEELDVLQPQILVVAGINTHVRWTPFFGPKNSVLRVDRSLLKNGFID